MAMQKRGDRNRMSILMVSPQPFFRARGTPFSILHRIRALLHMGHHVHLVTYPFGDPVPLDGLKITRSARLRLIKDIRIGPSIAKFLLDISLYFETVKQLKSNTYEVIHSHEEAAFFTTGLAKRFRLPHVYDMHSSLPQQLGNFRRYNFTSLRRIFYALERYVLENSDGIITICEDLANVVESICPEKPHSMIENTGDDTKVFTPRDADIRRDLGLEDKKIILYTGTFEAYQGLDLLLDSYAIVADRKSDAHLLFVGGRPGQVKDLQLRAITMGLEKRVNFVGTVPASEIPSYLNAADIIVSPRSSGTNTPLKLYGYMRSGVPLVATDKHTHTQTVDSNIAHLVPADVNGLSDGILQLLQEPEYASALAAAAIIRAEEKFSDAQYLRRVSEFYGKVFPDVYGTADDSDVTIAPVAK